MDDTQKAMALSVVRHLLSILGGVLGSKGLIDDAGWQQVSGATLIIIPIIWGILNKRQGVVK